MTDAIKREISRTTEGWNFMSDWWHIIKTYFQPQKKHSAVYFFKARQKIYSVRWFWMRSPLSVDLRILLKKQCPICLPFARYQQNNDIPGFPNLSKITLRKYCVKFGFCYKRWNKEIQGYQRFGAAAHRHKYLKDVQDLEIFYRDANKYN